MAARSGEEDGIFGTLFRRDAHAVRANAVVAVVRWVVEGSLCCAGRAVVAVGRIVEAVHDSRGRIERESVSAMMAVFIGVFVCSLISNVGRDCGVL